jgi:dTDP-4-dehydrorhamnose reductase
MRTLIFGAKGQLGRDLMTVFATAGAVRGYDLPEVNIADESVLQPIVENFGPDLIINAAAFTDVEAAEGDLQRTFLTNETGARNVADLAAYHGVPVVYYSTDYVFAGTSDRPYREDDPVAPLGAYGKSKAGGEAATRRSNPYHFIIRTAWLYGPGGNNFVEKILRAAATRPELRVVEEEVGSPTHTIDLAEATLALARTKKYGTYHAVNTGQCSRYEFARAIIGIAELDVAVAPCDASAFPTKAPRPGYSVLDTSKLTEVTGFCMRPWRKALLDYMQRRDDGA